MFKKLVLFLCMLLVPFNLCAEEKSYGDFENVKFLYNYDGDTITVNIANVHPLIGDRVKVRIYGIDTPEIKGNCEKEIELALQSKKFVYNILHDAESITLVDVKRDKYFRILADIKTSQGLLSKILVDKGYAIEYDGGTKVKNWCE